MEEEYLPLSASVEADAFVIDESHVLDLGEAVRQYTLLALPMKPVCRETCAGLCPCCGTNLNHGPCGCAVGHPDPPRAQLKSLVKGRQGAQERI